MPGGQKEPTCGVFLGGSLWRREVFLCISCGKIGWQRLKPPRRVRGFSEDRTETVSGIQAERGVVVRCPS